MSWTQVGDWFKAALRFITGAVKALAPAAATVGAATGHPEVVGAAKLAEVSATVVEKALDEGEEHE